MNYKPLVAEFVGTFMLMSAVLGAAFYSFDAPSGAAGILGVALSIGLTVMALVIVDRAHLGRSLQSRRDLGPRRRRTISSRRRSPLHPRPVRGRDRRNRRLRPDRPRPAPTYAANGFGNLSMIKAGLVSVFLIETLLTAFLLIVIMGSTRKGAPAQFAPIAIGLSLTAIHLMAIPVSKASVNPARSLGSAVFAGGEALGQLWVFWVAPILGGVVGALLYNWLDDDT